MTKKRKSILRTALGIVLLLVLIVTYNLWFSRTSIAFINYQPIALQEIAQANDNSFIRLHSVDTKQISGKLRRYDIIFVNGMGLYIDADQREVLQNLANKGTPIYTSMSTNPENSISNLTVEETAFVQQWLANGGRSNMRSLLSFLRRNIDGKVIFCGNVEAPQRKPSDYLWLPSSKGDELQFTSVAAFEDYLHQQDLWHEGAKRIMVTGMLTDPTDLINALVERGYNVYPLSSFTKTLDFIEEIAPDVVVNLAHGRLGDEVVNYLTEHNTLMFDPLTINTTADEWLADPLGMQSGFLSQSIVMPEIDGAIRTYALFAQRRDKNGLLQAYAMPDRLSTFVETIDRYMALRTLPNSEKKVAVVYYKSPGNSSLTASGLEVVPSLHRLLLTLQEAGYTLGTVPELADFRAAITTADAPIVLGNVALVRQPLPGSGEDEFRIVHGNEQDPSDDYIEAYRWIREDFGADALIHFGTHGSLEFTPRKQVALSSNDWPDRLVGSLPHFYLYCADNPGEAMTAKRRAYAQIISHLTPPYHESRMDDTFKRLHTALHQGDTALVRQLATQLGLDRDLAITQWNEDDFENIEQYAEELQSEKLTGTPYILGTPYGEADIRSSVFAMTTDPIAYSHYNLDRLLQRTTLDISKQRSLFEDTYVRDAKNTVSRLYDSTQPVSDAELCNIAGITQQQLDESRELMAAQRAPRGMLAMLMAASRKDSTENKGSGMAQMMQQMNSASLEVPDARNNPISKFMRWQMRKMLSKRDPELMLKVAKRMGASDEALEKMSAALHIKTSQPTEGNDSTTTAEEEGPSREQIDVAQAIEQIEVAIGNVSHYRTLLASSPLTELDAMLNALNGGYTSPSPGGDPVANPNILPTGRNLYAINAEETPSADAWERGVNLARNTIDEYRKKHDGQYPRKVSYTLWSGEFVQTGGATIAQVLYMLGVEPVRDRYGRVEDIRLIPDEELGRPRIDVVVQTSGQLRDLASSRLFLISRAVQMAAEAPKGDYENMVREGVDESERYLVDKGVAPQRARNLAHRRVFGGLNGGYGSGIQGMVQQGDAWSDEGQIAERYLYNMGAYYGEEGEWEDYAAEAFAAALTRTDAVVQPRQSNSWGALSLDHVYEFMGGMNLAVRNVTGKDPEAYFSDYRNRNAYRMQDSKTAIAVEARTKLLNKDYIEESLDGGATSSGALADMIRNAYGWNVMKPEAIEPELWDDIYDIYVSDSYGLNLHERMSASSPEALAELTTAMKQASEKGYWHATAEQLAQINQVQRQYGSSVQPAQGEARDAVVMEKQTSQLASEGKQTVLNGLAVAVAVVVAFVLLVVIVRRRRKNMEE